MPYSVRHIPAKGKPPWAKVNLKTHRIASRHATKALAKASIRAYYATRNDAPTVNRRNTLRHDPTRTTMIRKAFVTDVNKRFGRLRQEVRKFFVETDALGLKDRKSFITLQQPQRRQYEFQTDANKLTAFNDWFRQEVDAQVFSVPPGTPAGQPWTAKYVESAYKRGQMNAYLGTKQFSLAEQAGIGEQSGEQFLRSAFAQPETLSKVRLLATRSFEGMKGVTATMGADMNRILAQSMVEGRGAEEIAREMTKRIDGLTKTRARMIARTEVVNAHSEGQLDAFEALGVEELGVKAEWSTAGDDRVCQECAALEGQVFTMAEARGMIPLHPQCRCAWIPSEEDVKRVGSSQEPQAFVQKDEGTWEEFANNLHGNDRFTPKEVAAVSKYQGAGAKLINRHLRGTSEPQTGKFLLQDEITELDNLMDRSNLPENVLLFRGKTQALPAAGSIIEDKGFVSTTIDPDKAVGFGAGKLVAIRARGGSRAIVPDIISGVPAGEFEVLLPRGSKFMITGETSVHVTRNPKNLGEVIETQFEVVDLIQD